MVVSESGTVKGYSFKKWLKGTKESFKLILSAGIGFATWIIAKNVADVALAAALTGFVTAFSKWLLDLVDFWLSDVKL